MATNPHLAEKTATQPKAETTGQQMPTPSVPTNKELNDYLASRQDRQNNSQTQGATLPPAPGAPPGKDPAKYMVSTPQQGDTELYDPRLYGQEKPLPYKGSSKTLDDAEEDEEDDDNGPPYTDRTGTAPASAAPTVDTSAVAPDPYQALIDQYAKSSGQTIEDATKAINDIIAQLQGSLPNANGGRVDRVNTTEQENLLAQIVAAQQAQSQQRNDYAVQQGVDQLTRAMEDAAPQFQTMRNQAAAAEAQALDNQALYAEARGDRGGIGAAQYASIQNTAAQNQLTVNREQTKLATDTARQIADLRAQGEFKKADELLSITQSYLSELMQLKQWADQANISIDEFNIGVQQWEQEYNAKIQQALAGMKMDAAQWSAGQNLDNERDVLNMTLSNMQQQESKQAKVAEQMIAAGISPTDQQLQALGWNKDQFAAYKALLAAANSGGGGGGKKDTFLDELKGAIESGLAYDAALSAINQAKASELHDAQIIKDAYALINRNKSLMGKVSSP